MKTSPQHVVRLPALCAAVLVAAHLPQGAAAEQDESDDARLLEELVVTAQRREQALLDVPIAISVLDAQALSDLGVSSLRDLELLIPSTTFGFDNPVTIRGVGQQAWRDSSAEVGVATYQNGLFYNETYGLIESSLFDVERVEVLRGPQGTLYGRNAMGGAINIISKRPQQTFASEVLAEFTSFSGTRFNGAVTGPLGEGVSYRLTGGYVKRDGTAENVGSAPDAGRLDNYFASPQIRIETERLDANFRYAHYRADEGHVDQIFFHQFDTTNPNFPGPAGAVGGQNTHYQYARPAPSAVLSGPARFTDGIGEIKRKAVDHNRRNDRGISRDVINVEAQLTLSDNWALVYIGGWSDSDTFYIHDSDFTSRVPSATDPFLSADAGVPFRDGQANLAFPKKIHSNEVHLISERDDTTLLFGLYQFNETSPFALQSFEFANRSIIVNFRGCPATLPISRDCARDFMWFIDAEVDSLAAFANVDYRFSESWSVSGGLRYSEDKKEQSRNDVGNPFFSFSEEPAARTYDDWMGHLTLEFRPRSGQLIHGRYARAFRAGGFNSFTFGESPRSYGGEVMHAYEGGYKGSLNNGRTSLSINAYLYDYSDYQQNLSYRTLINGSSVDVSEWINIDGSQLFGVELETVFLITDNVRFRGFYAFTDSALGSLLAFNGANPDQEWVNLGEDEDVPVNPVDLDGNPFPSLARHQWSGSLFWNINNTAMGDFEWMTSYSWVGDRQGSIWDLDIDIMPAFSRWDMRLQWTPSTARTDAGKGFRVIGFVDNILDEFGVTENEARGWDEEFLREGQLTDGRLFGAEVSYRF